MKILFRLRHSKKSPRFSSIYCRISVNGQRCANDFSTGVRLERKFWNSKKQQAIGPNGHDPTVGITKKLDSHVGRKTFAMFKTCQV